LSEAPKPDPKAVQPNLRFFSDGSVEMSLPPLDPKAGPKEGPHLIPPTTKSSSFKGFGYIFFGANPFGLCKLNRKDDGHGIQLLRSEAEILRNENKNKIKRRLTKKWFLALLVRGGDKEGGGRGENAKSVRLWL